MPVFQAGDAGATERSVDGPANGWARQRRAKRVNPVEAAISYRKRRLLIRNRSPLLPHRILQKLAGSQSRQGLI